MILTRVNPSGQFYRLYSFGKQTVVETNRKSLTINMPIEEVNQAWFNWCQNGQYIQDAFAKLNADQREFLMTGITPDEWNSMIANDEA